jgi:hypothetical protein
MSEEQTGTLNEAGESSPPAVESDDLIATVDQAIPEPEETESQAPPEEAQKTEDQAEEAEEVVKEKPAPFHEHPRWQEKMRETEALKEQVAALEASAKQPPAEEPGYQDVGVMTNEEIQDKIDENPKGFLTDFAKQVRDEVRAEVMGEVEKLNTERKAQAEEKEVEARYSKYAEDNPDFNKMWDSGEIEVFMGENPGLDPMNAHILMTKDAREADIYRKAEAKAVNNLKTKKANQVISAGPSATGRPAGQTPAELKDTKKYGGLTSVLAVRSAQRNKAA